MAKKKLYKSSARVPTPEDIWRLFEQGAREQKELREAQKQADKRAEADHKRAEAEHKRAEAERKHAEAERKRMEQRAKAERKRMEQRVEAERKHAEAERKRMEQRAEVERKRMEQRAKAERKRIEQRAENEWQELRDLYKSTAEMQRNTSRGLDRLEAEGERLQKSINEASGKFDNQWGRFMEALVETDLPRALKTRGIDVWRTQPRLKFIDPRDRERRGEFDVVAYNGLQVVPTEAKTTLRVRHIKHFIENLRDFKVFFPEYKDKTVHGAVAYMGAAKGAEQYAVEQGLFIIKAPSTKTKITSIRNIKSFKPKKF